MNHAPFFHDFALLTEKTHKKLTSPFRHISQYCGWSAIPRFGAVALMCQPFCTMALWYSGTLVLWYFTTLVLYYFDTFKQRG